MPKTPRERTHRGRRMFGVVAAAALVLAGTACGAGAGSVRGTTDDSLQDRSDVETAPRLLTLTALGDSIPAASNCPGCESFIELFGDRIAEQQQVEVQVADLGIPGWTSRDLLDSLTFTGAATTVGASDVVTVTVGANDFFPGLDGYFEGNCADVPLHCFAGELAEMTDTLAAVLRLVNDLRPHGLDGVLVTGYWNVFPDGAVADRMFGPVFRRDSAELTDRVNRAIESVTTAAGATYVDLLEPFKGPGGSGDPTDLLADDGEHPNQAGHRKIADALATAANGYRTVP